MNVRKYQDELARMEEQIEEIERERDYWRGECERLGRMQYYDMESLLRELFTSSNVRPASTVGERI